MPLSFASATRPAAKQQCYCCTADFSVLLAAVHFPIDCDATVAGIVCADAPPVLPDMTFCVWSETHVICFVS